ncbi:Arginine-binding protein [Shigella dysenteriae 1617]|uniref:Arginine-binding protein n=2 Tax=Shigella dysenteriae 1617 TaxID=754093 RepID=A0A0A6ZU72_SHIDY|nr:Arginine-binding protein [Shigella dysenteriae 1617]
MAVTAAKSVMAFRVLTMAVDLCRLTTRTMNVNAGHERTSKARIIHQIQLIRGITQKENGTTPQKYIQDQHPEVKTVSYDSYQNAFIDLKNGRIDGVFGDTAVVNEWLKTNPQLGVATEKVTDPQYFGTGLGIAVRPDNKALLEKLNNTLAAIKADGTYQKISDQWFPQ